MSSNNIKLDYGIAKRYVIIFTTFHFLLEDGRMRDVCWIRVYEKVSPKTNKLESSGGFLSYFPDHTSRVIFFFFFLFRSFSIHHCQADYSDLTWYRWYSVDTRCTLHGVVFRYVRFKNLQQLFILKVAVIPAASYTLARFVSPI